MNIRLVFAAVAGLVLLLLAGWWIGSASEAPAGGADKQGSAATTSASTVGAAAADAGGPVMAGREGGASPSVLEGKLQALAGALSGQTEVAQVKAILADLKKAVHAESPDEAARQLIALLESGIDRSTGLEFLVGSEGVMEETPTLRTALLDLLGQTDPFLSADYARRILATTNSPDEYALALRNLGWANSDGALDGELRGYFERMLGRADWTARPTDGFLEAFDLAVATKAVDAVAPSITRPAAGGERQAEAAFLALDRIMLADPSAVVAAFRANPSFLSESPTHRASLLSRLDVRQPDHSRLLRDYLLRPDLGAEELEYFTRLFPNGNRVVGHRLVTGEEPGGSAADVALIDRATLGTLGSWLNDPAMASRRTEIEKMVSRLQDLTGTPPAPAGR